MASHVAADGAQSNRPPHAQNRLFHYILRYKWYYVGGIVALIGAGFLAMLPPLVLRYAIDELTEGTSVSRLARLGGLIVVLAIAESVVRFGSRLLVSSRARYIEYHMRADLADQFTRLDQGFYLGARTGDLMARCTNDLNWVRDFLGPTVSEMGRAGVMLLVGGAFLFSIDVKLTLIAFAYFPFIAAAVIFLETTLEEKFRRVQDQFGHLTNRTQENISGIRAIKAYAQEHAEIDTFAGENRELMRRTINVAIFQAGFFPMMILATGVGTALVIWFGGRDVVSSEITIGQFVQFNTYLVLLSAQLTAVGWFVTAWQQFRAAMARISETLTEEPAIADPPEPRHLEWVRGDIEFRDVSFARGGEPVLEHIDLSIPAGSTIAIVGETGAGKTTLVDLLVRLIDTDSGSVTIDQVDVRELSLQQLRDVVGFVPQEAFLFSDSLRENISFGRIDAQERELQGAVATSQLSKDLEQLGGGIDTVIGERGMTLSGGQKQRAALARALIKDPPILVLDDALSHVDTHTEEEILRRLREFMANRTTIVIAHRTSTLAGAERIIVLDDHVIAEQGTHAELVERDGLYARFYRRQLLREQKDAERGSRESDDGSEGNGP